MQAVQCRNNYPDPPCVPPDTGLTVLPGYPASTTFTHIFIQERERKEEKKSQYSQFPADISYTTRLNVFPAVPLVAASLLQPTNSCQLLESLLV